MSKRTGRDLSTEIPEWLWEKESLLPRNELAMLVGYDGHGKSSFMLKLVAEMTRGTLSGTKETVFLSMIEDAESIVRARLQVHDADLGRTVFQPAGQPAWAFPADFDAFSAYMSGTGATVAILDSMDYHVHNLGSQLARQTLGYMHELGERLGTTIIFVHHFNKDSRSIDVGIGGGRAVKAAMRTILVWGEAPQTPKQVLKELLDVKDSDEDEDPGTHILAVHKNSYGLKFPAHPSLLYNAESVPNPLAPLDKSKEVWTFEHLDYVTVGPNSIFTARMAAQRMVGEETRKVDRARDLIIRFLATYTDNDRWMPARELMQNVMAAGIGERTVEKARKQLVDEGEIESRTDGPGGQWYWRVKFNIPESM